MRGGNRGGALGEARRWPEGGLERGRSRDAPGGDGGGGGGGARA